MAAIDNYPGGPGQTVGVEAGASHAAIITGDDSTDLTYTTRGLLCDVAGNLKVTMRGSHGVAGETLILPLQAGYNPLRVSRIWLASKTVTTVIALW